MSPEPQQLEDGAEGAFARYFAEVSASARGVKSDKRGSRIVGGRFNGKTQEEAMEIARREFAEMDDESKATYASQARGDDLKPASASLPFQPSATMKDMRGAPVKFGPSASAPARSAAMAAKTVATAQAGAAAVKAAQANQAADPTGVAMRAQAAKDAVLAQSGITDMGGGTVSIDGKYGTGFAERIDPTKPRTPGRIFDEKGEVNVADMMANKGQNTTVPYLQNGGDAIGADVAGGIQQGIAAAAPGMADRRSADIAKSAATFAASLPPAMQAPPSATPMPAISLKRPALPNDTPGAASTAAQTAMMTPKPTVMAGAMAALPPALRQPPAAKAKPNMQPKMMLPKV